jgi:putative ABC transport system ATP-binding protein
MKCCWTDSLRTTIVRIEVSDLHKTYRGSNGQLVPALCGVNLRVEPGEFVAISGSSGCGKSTLLNVIGCLDRPDQGSCELDGEDVVHWPERHRAAFRNHRIGFVFQSFHLLPFLTVRQNVELPYLYSEDNPPEEDGVLGLLESVGLGGTESRLPSELSGGQQQRVAIARALVHGADLLLADEPTGNLDAAMAQTILDLFSELAAQGKTVLLVTHDPAVARRAKRQLQMSAGRIVQDSAASQGATV